MTTTKQEPRELAEESMRNPELPSGDGERYAGYGVIGQPFSSGHYLAMRHFSASSIGPGYRAVLHRDPKGAWMIYTDAEPEQSCARYFSTALAATHQAEIDTQWTGNRSLTIQVADVLTWTVELNRTHATRLMSGIGAQLPDRLWRNDSVLRAMGTVASSLLGAGRLRLGGLVPNGQVFQAGPRQVWEIAATRASWHGQDLGTPAPLATQDRLGDMWLPQKGLFAIVEARFQP